jgi:hypothetical protein
MYWIAKEELSNNKFVSLINLIERLRVQKMKPWSKIASFLYRVAGLVQYISALK